MKKQKRQSSVINFLGVIIGIIFLLVALTSGPTSDASSALIPGVLFGMLIIFLSLTSIGDADLSKWPFYRRPLILFNKVHLFNFWTFLIFGILAIAAIGAVLLFAPDQFNYQVQNK